MIGVNGGNGLGELFEGNTVIDTNGGFGLDRGDEVKHDADICKLGLQRVHE